MSVLSTLALMPYVSRLAPLVHNEHMNGGWKDLAFEMPCLKDEIQARGRNIVIASAHHGPIATNTGHEKWQDKALLQESREMLGIMPQQASPLPESPCLDTNAER
jgi:hypothetical protein